MTGFYTPLVRHSRGDAALCGHRTTSKSQAGEARRGEAGPILKETAFCSSTHKYSVLGPHCNYVRRQGDVKDSIRDVCSAEPCQRLKQHYSQYVSIYY